MPILSQDALCSRPVGLPFWMRRWIADVGPLRSRPGSPAQPISRSAPTGSLQVDFSRSGFEQRGVPRAVAATRDLSARRPARFHAALEGCANAPGANGQRVHRDAQPFRQVASTIDLLPQRIAVVLDDQLALFRLELLETTVETVETLFPQRQACFPLRQPSAPFGWQVEALGGVNPNMHAFPTDVLQQDESRNYVTVACGRSDADDATLLQGARDAVERLVGELIRR